MGGVYDTLVLDAVRGAATPLEGARADYDPLMRLVGDARFVLLGEATHGTHEFYRERAEITKRLIAENGFTAVAVEADWPDAYRVNRYVRGAVRRRDADEALGGFKRFPDVDVAQHRRARLRRLAARAQRHARRRTRQRSASTGSTCTASTTSMEAVLGYLETVDPEAARRARYALLVLRPLRRGHAGLRLRRRLRRWASSCEDEVVKQLVELRRSAADYAQPRRPRRRDEYFFAEQNARLVKNAEEYYRTMFRGRVVVLEPARPHMAETLDALDAHLARSGQDAARRRVGAQLAPRRRARHRDGRPRRAERRAARARAAYGARAVLVGFTTHHGHGDRRVRLGRARPSASACGRRCRKLRGAVPRDGRGPHFLLILRGEEKFAARLCAGRACERAIGVIYLPRDASAQSHYFHARPVGSSSTR